MADLPASDDAPSTPSVDGTHDSADGTYRVRSHESVAEAVVRAVCSETQSDGMDLPPLYSSVETDALNRLFAHGDSEMEASRQPRGVVGFTHAGHRVRVRSNGAISVAPTDQR